MSGPLSSLRKSQKHPMFGSNMGQRPVPFRNPHYTGRTVSEIDDESKLLDEITGHMTTQKLKTRDPFTGGLPRLPDLSPRAAQGFGMAPKGVAAQGLERSYTDLDDTNTPPSDHELMSTMMSRITQLEAKMAYQAKELADKEKKIKVLSEKNKLLQKAQENDSYTQTAELENKCYELQEQIHQMETFLADYGMVWVGEETGNNSDDDDSEDELWRPASSVSQQPTFKVDYNKLIENIRDLNALAGEGSAFITQTKDGARLKMQDSVQLTLYANGFLMFNGPFRPFTDPVTQTCVQDMLDGYFPSELQGRYPDGVPFNVTDRREVHYEDKRADIFTGEGQTLGGEVVPSRLVPTKLVENTKSTSTEREPVSNSEKRETTSERPGPQLTIEQFLNKLPKSVMKAGKIIDIRSSVGDSMQGGKQGPGEVTLIETDTVLAMRKRLEGNEPVRPFTPRDITTLRIKSEDGNHTYILKMRFSDTIGDLRHYIVKQRGDVCQAFDIVSAHPTTAHTDDSMTLLDAGLTPNAVAHLKKKT
ncbi:UBX domain-containing protein 11-like isoform X2 [Mya arenaria]|uniref:UBX domain-containing protein 11-like isoform X2 n=1 Tax=Mya arenaria TaxID=6604 RepID=UPI0022E36A65|nr:UBX domain-containing protein 11-like isoform X2 [Mya arenaria]